MSKFGFYSIVFKDGNYHIRARSEEDLKRLLLEAGLPMQIHQSKNADYPVRAVTNERDFIDVIFATLGESIDYPNFKDMIARQGAQRDKLPWYHEIWTSMREWQLRVASKPGAVRRRTTSPAVAGGPLSSYNPEQPMKQTDINLTSKNPCFEMTFLDRLPYQMGDVVKSGTRDDLGQRFLFASGAAVVDSTSSHSGYGGKLVYTVVVKLFERI